MRGAIEAHLGSRQVSRVVYGAVIGLALVVALQDHPPAAGVVLGTLCGTAVAVGLAELYSDFIGTETRTHRRPDRRAMIGIAEEAGAAAFGIAFPAVYFLLATVGAIELDTAFTLAKWTGLGLIGVYGFLSGRLAGRSVAASALHALAVGLIGGFLILLKALVH